MQRLDLPTLPRDCAAAAELMSRHLRGDGCTAAVLVVYENVEGEGALAGETVAARLHDDRVQVVDHVVVRGDRAFFPGQSLPVSYTHLDVYKRQSPGSAAL